MSNSDARLLADDEPPAFLEVPGQAQSNFMIVVDHAGSRIGQIAVPDFIGTFRQIETPDLAAPARIKKAELYPLGMSRKYRKIYPQAVPGSAERIRCPAIKLDRVRRHRLSVVAQINRRKRRQHDFHGIWLAVRGELLSRHPAFVSDVRPTIKS